MANALAIVFSFAVHPHYSLAAGLVIESPRMAGCRRSGADVLVHTTDPEREFPRRDWRPSGALGLPLDKAEDPLDNPKKGPCPCGLRPQELPLSLAGRRSRLSAGRRRRLYGPPFPWSPHGARVNICVATHTICQSSLQPRERPHERSVGTSSGDLAGQGSQKRGQRIEVL